MIFQDVAEGSGLTDHACFKGQLRAQSTNTDLLAIAEAHAHTLTKRAFHMCDR